MEEFKSSNKELLSEAKRAMSSSRCVQMEIQDRVRELVTAADPMMKVGLHKVASTLRIKSGRLRQLLYGAARRIEAWEADEVRRLHTQMEHLRQEQAQINQRIAALLGQQGNETHRSAPHEMACLAEQAPPRSLSILGENP